MAGSLVQVNNAGVIQMTQLGALSPTDTLTIRGNYTGIGGSILLDTYLGVDGSPSDKLIISGGLANGLTGIGIVNAGGPGGGTTGSGIMVVQATNGGSTATDAFVLDRAVAAGAYRIFPVPRRRCGGRGAELVSALATPAGPGAPASAA
ncbi:autotransporter outer membrane beta-barrel domain-containing protein [Devosia sp. A8/3-2]|nr:autotransporter outer membrane beta-barrel domain-containing protein [Devosia sp. A8/3-2]